MTDEDTGAPRSAARDDGAERPKVTRARPRVGRPSDASPHPAEQAASWQARAAWFDDEGVADRSADLGADLVNLGFFRAALRRSRVLWIGVAAVGLVLGVAFWAMHPPKSEAATTLLLNVGPEGQPGTAILNDQALAQSRGVAGIAVRKLGSAEGIGDFLATYKATVVTDRVLRITVSAPSAKEAVNRANAIATAFLSFRADQLRTQQRLEFAALDDVLNQSERHLQLIRTRISEVATQPTSDSQQAELDDLRAASSRARSELVVLKAQVDAAKATAQETTAAMVGQSRVLDAASPLQHSRLKPMLLFSGVGLILGLVVGVGSVILRALISDRLRRRDDVAHALGAPVRLSVPTKPRAWRPVRRGMAAARGSDVQRIVAFLHGTLPTGAGCRAMAVVPVDDTRVSALSVVSLAVSVAQQGAKVVVADLCSGAPAARLVGIKDPGVHVVQVDGTQIDIAIPDHHEITPVGPFGRMASKAQDGTAGQVAAACASADVLLTLTSLDPSLASDHLHTWAADVIVMVTAGRSSWTKIHAVGEMVRLAGTRLVAAVLVGADKWDETLGVTAHPGAGREAGWATGTAARDAGPAESPTMSRFMSR